MSAVAGAGLDEEVFAETWRDTYAAIVRHLTYRVPVCDAEDVASNAYLKAWERRVTFRPEAGSITTWLYQIARNQAVDWHRRSACRPHGVADSHTLQVGDGTDLAEEAAQRLDFEAALARVKAALDTLPPGQRRMVEMRYFEGLNSTQVAAITGLAVGTVKSNTSRGVAALRRALEA